ncbi:MAG TPA: aldehyde dehydrogenase family protein [Terriglobia bacterium]|nr:aldehyde dehydrogenase family protein [Terriglobia bacterium]
MNYQNLIDGKWTDPADGGTHENRNPANNNECVGVFPSSTEKDVDRAVSAAKEAFKTWRLVPAPHRAEILFRAAEKLVARKEEFARDMTREMGKALKETRGDVQEAIDMTYYMAGEGRRMFGQTTPAELPEKFAMSTRNPVGVCGLITPWNFPMAIPSWKVMPALVAGNTVVLKPAEDTPLSTWHLVKVLEEAGIPPGVVNLVMGSGKKVGVPLTSHPGINLMSFTGSTAVGREVAVTCAPSFRRVHLEMGGKNALMIMDDANVDLAVDGAIWGGFGTAGQRCTAASRAIVHKKVLKEFTDKFIERARRLKVGNGLDPGIEVGPVVNETQLKRVQEYIRIGAGEGARLLCGGNRLETGALKDGYFLEPTIFGDVDRKMRIAQEEIFGPVVAIIPCNDFDDAVEIANGVQYGLSAAIYTADVNRAFRAMRDMETGIFYVNASTIGAEVHLPFGGLKSTGNGHREAGTAALDVFSEWKSIYVDYSGRLQKAQGID